MAPNAPFENPPVYKDYYAGSVILAGLGTGQVALCDEAMQGIAPCEINPIPEGTLTPLGRWMTTGDLVLVAISGTKSVLQWVCHILGSVQEPNAFFPGQVNSFFASVALSMRAALADQIEPLIASQRLVLIGHSFGGAIAQLLGVLWTDQAQRGILCITYGAPRVGNPTFADAVDFPVHRIQDTGDPIPSLPPEAWFGQGTPWGPFPPFVRAAYEHAGTPHTLHVDGSLNRGEELMTFNDAVTALLGLSLPDHEIHEYMRRLSGQEQNQPPDVDWKDPAEIDAVNDIVNSLYPPNRRGSGMALFQGTLFFTTNEEGAGWSESFYGTTDLTSMLDKLKGLIKPRANCLSDSCSIIAYRAANVDPARTANQSRAKRLDVPAHGSVNIKDAGDVSVTNETMDAIDYMLISSATTSRRVYPFRGVPDGWIEGSKRSAAGVQGSAKIESFLTAVQNANLGFRVRNRDNAPKNIESVAANPQTGDLNVMITGHGYTSGNIVIVKRLNSNRMVNGRWKIKRIDANNFTLVGSNRFNVDSDGEGTVTLYSPQADAIDDFFFNNISTRRTGRPFGLRRGKQSAKLLHH